MTLTAEDFKPGDRVEYKGSFRRVSNPIAGTVNEVNINTVWVKWDGIDVPRLSKKRYLTKTHRRHE